jgi:predicted DNA-binding transcriptional regulator AlpA
MRYMGEAEVHRLSDLSRSTRWRLEKLGEFPFRRKISRNRIGWVDTEIWAWLRSRQKVGCSGGRINGSK